MKTSRYNLCLRDHTGMVIYNAKSDEIIVLNPELSEFVEQGMQDQDIICKRHPELFELLTGKGVFVEDDADETSDYIDTLARLDTESKDFTITVNPTLACNMRCWYCYEDHKSRPVMKEDVRESVISLVNSIVASHKYSVLNLSFFGGEPLMWHVRLLPLREEALACTYCEGFIYLGKERIKDKVLNRSLH